MFGPDPLYVHDFKILLKKRFLIEISKWFLWRVVLENAPNSNSGADAIISTEEILKIPRLLIRELRLNSQSVVSQIKVVVALSRRCLLPVMVAKSFLSLLHGGNADIHVFYPGLIQDVASSSFLTAARQLHKTLDEGSYVPQHTILSSCSKSLWCLKQVKSDSSL